MSKRNIHTKKEECIIFGASVIGGDVSELVIDKYEVVAFCDNSKDKWGTIYKGKPVLSPDQLLLYPDAVILVATVYYSVICRQLFAMGIEKQRICFRDRANQKYYLFDAPKYRLFEKSIYSQEIIDKIEGDIAEKTNSKRGSKTFLETKKSVLIVAYFFPPLGGPGCQRPLKFAKYLSRNGYDVHILTVGQHCPWIENHDESLLADVDSSTEIIRIDELEYIPENLTIQEQQEIFNLYALILKDEQWCENIRNEFALGGKRGKSLLPDNQLVWVNNSIHYLLDHQKYGFDYVITTGIPFSDFFVGWYLKKYFDVSWIMDYRDPWITDNYYNEKMWEYDSHEVKLMEKIEKRFVSEADLILCVNEDQKLPFIEKYGIGEDKIIEIANGYDEDDFKDISVKQGINKKFTILYSGSIPDFRNPLPILESVNRLIKKGKVDKEKVEIRFIGRVQRGKQIVLREKDCFNIVTFKGYVSHDDSVSELVNADLLLLLKTKSVSAKNGIGGKTYEYIRSGRPILCLVEGDMMGDDILTVTQTGCFFQEKDEEQIDDYVYTHYLDWNNGERKSYGIKKEVEKYSREKLTVKLCSYLRKIEKRNSV